MNYWVTSDTHFNHKNILKYEAKSRPFETVEEMNEKIINNWNEKIKDEDIVFHCGDFFMGTLDNIKGIIDRLNGTIILIRGNHDTKKRIETFKECGIEVKDIEYFSYKGKYFIFNHFPLQNDDFSKMIFKENKEIIYCYGHVHGAVSQNKIGNSYHVGLDTHELYPVNLKDIIKEFEKEDENE